MAAKKILFLSPRTVHTSQRQQELSQSDARSHAAKISVQRSKLKRSKLAVTRASKPAQDNQGLVPANRAILPPTPLAFIRKGNSDPFASYAVEISPRVNDLIDFFSTYYASTAHQPHLSVPNFRNDVLRQTIASILQDECSAQAFLLSFMTLKSNLSPEDLNFQQETRRLSKQAVVSLRSNTRNIKVESDIVLTALKFHFMAAAFAGNIFEATMHGTMLKDQLLRKWLIERQSLDLGLLMHIVFVDGQLALKHLTHTIFDMEWVERVLEPALSPTEIHLQPFLSEINDGLDRSIDEPTLQTLIGQVRKGQYLRTHTAFDTSEGFIYGVWLGIRAGATQAHLANYYYAVQRRLSTNKLSAEDRFAWLSRCAAALAMSMLVNTPESMALYKLQVPGGDKVTARLRQIVAEIQIAGRYLPSNIDVKYQNAHLFALFIGAQGEQRKLRGAPFEAWQASKNTWFTRIFAHQACRMRVFTWDAVRAALERILYFDELEPRGSEWVDHVIGQMIIEKATGRPIPEEQVSFLSDTSSQVASSEGYTIAPTPGSSEQP